MPTSSDPPISAAASRRSLAAWPIGNWKAIVAVVAALAAAEAYCFGPLMALQWTDFWARPAPPSQRPVVEPVTHQPDLLHYHPALAIQTPPTVRARAASLADDELVLGVSAGESHRAYRLEAMAGSEDHVVNDVLANVPITVTYCNIARCTRVFSAPRTDGPLDVRQVGLDLGRLRFVIETAGRPYFQDTQQPYNPDADATPFPLTVYPSKVMSWKEWKALHPETDLYAVPVPEASRQPR